MISDWILRSLSFPPGCSCGYDCRSCYLTALQSLVEDIEPIELFVSVHSQFKLIGHNEEIHGAPHSSVAITNCMISKLRAVDWKSRRVAFRAALVVVALLAVWAAVAYLIPDEPNDEPPESMFVLFDSSAYQRLIERLDKSNRTVIAGKQEDGLNVFLKYYLQQSGRSPIRHRSF